MLFNVGSANEIRKLVHPFFFRRDTFIRDRKLSTGILGKNKRCSVLKFLDVRDELDNLTVYSAKKDSELKDVS